MDRMKVDYSIEKLGGLRLTPSGFPLLGCLNLVSRVRVTLDQRSFPVPLDKGNEVSPAAGDWGGL